MVFVLWIIFMIWCYFKKVRKHSIFRHLMFSVPLSPKIGNPKMYGKISRVKNVICGSKRTKITGQNSICDNLVETVAFEKTSKYRMSELFCPLTTNRIKPSFRIYLIYKVLRSTVTKNVAVSRRNMPSPMEMTWWPTIINPP